MKDWIENYKTQELTKKKKLRTKSTLLSVYMNITHKQTYATDTLRCLWNRDTVRSGSSGNKQKKCRVYGVYINFWQLMQLNTPIHTRIKVTDGRALNPSRNRNCLRWIETIWRVKPVKPNPCIYFEVEIFVKNLIGKNWFWILFHIFLSVYVFIVLRNCYL